MIRPLPTPTDNPGGPPWEVEASPTEAVVPAETTQVEKEKDILEYFPLPSPRASQKVVIKAIDDHFKAGKRVVILEGPVGSGKSAVAVTFARYQAAHPSKIPLEEGKLPPAPCHILTPRKSLQDQYFEDFPADVVTMKGRGAYPCIFDTEPKYYYPILKAIEAGKSAPVAFGEPTCSEGPCKDSREIWKSCTQEHECPYTVAVGIAQSNATVVHNLHSFLYQTNFSDKFEKRSLMIIDEAHEIESTIRDFATRKVYVNSVITDADVAGLKGVKDWVEFLLTPKYVPETTERDAALKAQDESYKSKREEYQERVAALELKASTYEKGFSVEINPHVKPGTNIQTGTTLELVPHYVGGEVNRLLLDHGEKILLMSGTIYDKGQFCQALGIPDSECAFIRVGSSFPKENRPVYLMPKYQTNTSHAKWDQNFDEIVGIIQNILAIFHDAKGLIHAPSYYAAYQLERALASDRVITHEAGDFLTKLASFFSSKGNGVFISPVCQQGVDFKEDRARFQIVLRVPYPNTSSQFVKDKLANHYAWYNYQALVVLGQQLGRVNRSESDFGATFLIDERFNSFISKNKKYLPKWVTDAVIYQTK